MKQLNETITAIAPSATLAITSKAAELKAQGIKVCAFAAGEPDFNTPDCIKKACAAALDADKTRYVAAAGLPELRTALCEKLQKENGVSYEPSQVLVANGGKHALSQVFQTLINPGDEVIIPAPFWLSYPEMVRVAGGIPVFVKTSVEDGFLMSPEQLEAAITPRTVAVVMNSPSNPTGMMYTPEQLRAIGEVAINHDLWIVSDEIYEKMVYGDVKQASMASFGPEFYDHTITVNGFSKTFAMTGWRLGYAAGPKPFMKALFALQSHMASAPNTFTQWGAIAALQEAGPDVDTMVKAFTERRERIYQLISAIPGIKCPKPDGAFYVFPDISSFGMTSLEFAARLLEEKHVAVVPGIAFGDDACVRLSYACSMENIEEGLSRFADFCASLKQ
ncbi:MAG: pyridoxal phosphate-dependent aminotransferase [Kiritimatiellae bacterium]|nr:pyridoxal phosphate-dependent aminotransferase [Kiritimatiellia bacterium]MBR4946079.1 pyridoxal phosphate-dependent aminotransferase [Kiritimatiellia bacterium]MBR5587960.1 pyridoxal phosphate-dependent aminotransferase [Kiritimatiellia bacterium]